jgi:hypothetical protein
MNLADGCVNGYHFGKKLVPQAGVEPTTFRLGGGRMVRLGHRKHPVLSVKHGASVRYLAQAMANKKADTEE